MSMSPIPFRRMLPIPQLIAEPIARANPTSVRSWPTVRTISTSPAKAVVTPAIWRVVGRSRRTIAANTIVNSAWVWTSSDASPGGRLSAIAKNCRRNWPAKSVAPIAIRRDHATGGRGSTSAGTAAIAKRSAVSAGGEKLSSARPVATNASPQMTATSSASATGSGFRATLAQDGAPVVARVDDAGARGYRREVLRDLPAERLQRFDVAALAGGQDGPGCRLVGRGHDHRSDEVVVGDALEEVERHSGFRSGRLRASADHSSVARRLISIAFSHSSSE